MDTVSVSFAPEGQILPLRIYADVDDDRGLLCATPILIDNMLLQLPEGTWNVIIEIGE